MGKIVKTAKPEGGIWTAAGKATSRRTTKKRTRALTGSTTARDGETERERQTETDRERWQRTKQRRRWHGKLTKPRQRDPECPNAAATAAAAALVRRICNLFLTVCLAGAGCIAIKKGVLAGREACKIYLPWLLMPQSRASRGQTQRRRHRSHCCCCWWCIFELSKRVGMWLHDCAAATVESHEREEILFLLGGPAWPANYTLWSEIGSSRQLRTVPHGLQIEMLSMLLKSGLTRHNQGVAREWEWGKL